MYNYATYITNALTAQQVAERYGFEPDRAGKICCPFHHEDTPSLKLYEGNKGFHCFGCNVGGDVIDFVKLLFSLNFMQAITKMNDDFYLHLPINNKQACNNKNMCDEISQQERTRLLFNANLKAIDIRRYAIQDSIAECETIISNYTPKQPDEQWDNRFLEALQKHEYLKYLLENIEVEREVLCQKRRM